MNKNTELANLLFPDNKYTIEEIEKKYPKRKLKDGAQVTRFAPSPTGFLHLGGFFQAMVDFQIVKQNGGVFMLRIEDTDKKREIAGSDQIIMSILTSYGLTPDEFEMKGGVTVGDYGPYYQSERTEIYKAYAKKLVEQGDAFPCFCRKTEGLSDVEEKRKKKFAVGLNEDKDPCRNLTIEQVEQNLKEGKKFAIRLKSKANGDGKVTLVDVVKGKIELQENGKDAILLKDDLTPTYHFAHAVDDTLMGTTIVVRGEEWLPSYPLHKEIFEVLGFEQPKYMHTPLIYQLNDKNNKNKLSKRKHPEADMRHFDSVGYPKDAILEYLTNLANSKFESWREKNPNASYWDFPFDAYNITANTPIFDFVKLDDISKEIISKMDAQSCYESLLLWAKENADETAKYLEKDAEYVKKVLNIDREKPKPRKDISKWSEFFDLFAYMFSKPKKFEVENKKEFEEVIKNYKKYLDLSSKDVWFDKVKKMSEKLGYATNNSDYKKNPQNFKGNVAKVCEYIRLAITGQQNSPDLFEIMTLLGEKEVLERLDEAL